MAAIIRRAAAQDAPAWLELFKADFGEDYPDRQFYDPAWIAEQLQAEGPLETWVAELDGQLQASASFLNPSFENNNPVANIGRHFSRPESFTNGSAAALLEKLAQIGVERKRLLISRVLASNNALQIAYEKAGFFCIGFQPFKHTVRVREGSLFYYRMGGHDLANRLPLSESLPQVAELADAVLAEFDLQKAGSIRDGVTGYPLQSELQFNEGSLDDFEIWKIQSQAANPTPEISGAYNQGSGFLRNNSASILLSVLGLRNGIVSAGILYALDEVDRCVRLVDSFSQDDISLGAVLNHVVRVGQQKHSALYVEMDVLTTAPRLLKSAEQLGFVPVAYIPAIYAKGGNYADVIKLIKLNIVYSLENASLTAHAKTIVNIIDQNFQDQKMGVGIINLLRGLPFFEGLGDGELRKIARLFTQKLYRAGEKIFAKGDTGAEAYVVMRGQIDILLEEGMKPLAQVGSGQIFGELAFLDSTSRAAGAIASQPSILLVIQRSAFNNLVEHEPHLGMVVMRNIAIELSNRLRKTNAVLVAARK